MDNVLVTEEDENEEQDIEYEDIDEVKHENDHRVNQLCFRKKQLRLRALLKRT